MGRPQSAHSAQSTGTASGSSSGTGTRAGSDAGAGGAHGASGERRSSLDRFCFVHAADLHLDTPFEGFADVPPAIRDALRDASLEAFEALIDLAIERDAAFFVLAGDVYDGAERGVRAQIRLRDGLARLADEGIPSFVVHGNHDPVHEGWSAIRAWPDGVTIFGAGEQPEAVAVEREGRPLAVVQGLSFARRDERENLARRYRRSAEPGLQVGVLHCNVDGAGGHADYAPCTRADLEAVGLDYWALGHVHTQSVLLRGDCWAVYPGNLQGRSPKPSERGAKGAVVVHAEAGRVLEVEPVALDRVRFAQLEVSIEDCTDLAAVSAALEEAGDDALADADGRSLVVRGRLVGRSALRADLARDGALEGLRDALRDQAQGRRPFLWWDRLEDDTRSELDRDRLRRAGDFRAALLDEADALQADPAALAELLGELPGRVAGLALEEWSGLGGASDLQTIVENAEREAIDALELSSEGGRS